MPTQPKTRRASLIVLCVSLVVVVVIFGLRANYGPVAYLLIAAIQLTVICTAAWILGLWGLRSGPQERRRLAAAGGLLIMPFALFSLLAGLGPPSDSQNGPAHEELRFLVLLVNSIAVAGGFVLLKEALTEAGERFHSTLGFAAGVLAAPMYVIFTAIQLVDERVALREGGRSQGYTPLDDLGIVLLFFGGVLTYLATAAFSASLCRLKWIGHAATGVFVSLSFLALLILVNRGLDYPDLSGPSSPWYTLLGFVAGIPAVPWMMPCALGVILLRRAGDEPR